MAAPGIKPHVVRELRMPDGTVVYQAKPETRRALESGNNRGDA